MTSSANPRPPGKLGLALAGGGFRASLFHVGVLRRLAELDVLRRVEVLSTVSGGSITGALYVLLLKKYLEHAQPAEGAEVSLSRDQYIRVVTELEEILVRGVGRDLRTRLVMNPLGTLLVLLTGDSFGRRMARLYERYLLDDVVRQLSGIAPPPWWRPRWLWPGQIRMHELSIRPGGRPVRDGLAAYNARQRATGGSVVTSIVINATTMNTGGRFFFSAAELGDWYLGSFRESEFGLLLARKALLALDNDELALVAHGTTPPPAVESPARGGRAAAEYRWAAGEAERVADLELRRRAHHGARQQTRDAWQALYAVPEFPGELADVALGALRPAKTAAWYIQVGSRRDPQVLGGRSLAEHTAALWTFIQGIDPDLGARLADAVRHESVPLELVADYILELYWLRSAERVSHNIADHWNDVRVGHAVGASACFPPVFPTFLMYGVYDDLHVPRLGLTDGGVYDNVGVTALLDEDCTEIIASDTSGLFTTTPAAATGHVGLAARLPDLLMRALGGVQRQALRERRRVSRSLDKLARTAAGAPTPLQQEIAAIQASRALDALVYFHIASPRVEPAEPQQLASVVPALHDIGVDGHDVAALRTDLDGFGDVEVAALINHGYDMADRYVRRYAPGLADTSHGPPRAPRPFHGPNATPARAARILRVGSARFTRALKLNLPVAWGAVLAIVAGAAGWVWIRQLTLMHIVDAGAGVVRWQMELLDFIMAALRLPAASQSPALLVLILAVGAVLLFASTRHPRRPAHGHRRAQTSRRRLMTIGKWISALKGNALWLLLGLPAVIAAALAVLANIGYVFFHLPFMRAVRIPPLRNTKVRSAIAAPPPEVPAGGAD